MYIFFHLLVFSLLIPFGQLNANAFDIDDIIQRYNEKQWELGKNLAEGDVFVYDVCDSVSFSKAVLHHDDCYVISLEFVALLNSPTGNVWIIQAIVLDSDDDDSDNNDQHAIFHINADTFDVTTDRTNIEFAESVKNTIFYLGQFTNNFPKTLEVGNTWGAIPSYMTPDPNLTVRQKSTFFVNSADTNIPVFDVGFTIREPSIFQVSSSMPFPVSATMYDPQTIFPKTVKSFSFEMLQYFSSEYGAVVTERIPDVSFEANINPDVFEQWENTGHDNVLDDLEKSLNMTSIKNHDDNSMRNFTTQK